MTDGSSSKLDNYLRLIIKYCDDIAYLIGLYGSDEEDFKENIQLQYGCVFSMEQIGELIKRLPEEMTRPYPQIDWDGMKGMRDKIAHSYARI